jgi:tetratricopeptide (TPR) repeat protein
MFSTDYCCCDSQKKEKGLRTVKAFSVRYWMPGLGRSGRPAGCCILAVALFFSFVCSSDDARSQNSHVTAKEEFNQAQKFLGQGHLEEALAAVQQGLELEPRSVEGLNLLGIIYGSQKEYAKSVAAFQQALQLNPGSPTTHNNLGMLYSSQNKLDLAQQEFRTTLKLDSKNHEANYNLGLVLLAQGKPGEAIALLQRVEPADTSVKLRLAEAYLRAGQTDKGLEVAKTLSIQATNDVRVHFSLAVVLAAEKHYKLAEREFELADALQPGTFEILYNLGQAYLATNDQAQAEASLLRALKLRPDSVETLYQLGKLYMDQRKYVHSMEMLEQARRLAPNNPDVIFLLGRVAMLQYYFEDAIQLLKQGVEIAPQRPDLHAALGESYFMAGNLEKGIQEFQTLVKLDPSASSHNFLGLCYRHMGRFEEARKYFQEGHKLDPKYAPCLYNLGYIENKEGHTEIAAQLLEAALKANPNYDDALYELASVKIAEKQYPEALELLQRCLKVALRPAQVYYRLSIVERALHQTEAATRDMKIFETLSKEPSEQPYPLQHLFENFDQRLEISGHEKTQLELQELLRFSEQNPDHPSTAYLLAEKYLKLGEPDEAKKWVAELDRLSGDDLRMTLGVGVLLARYQMYPEAIKHFQAAEAADPSSDDAKYDLAQTYFKTGDYNHALEALQGVSPNAQSEDTNLALLGNIYAHLGLTKKAIEIFAAAVRKNPENDQYYLSLAMAHLRAGEDADAEAAMRQGFAHIPNSGKLFWGMGILSALEGKNDQAEDFLRRAVDLMPEWQGGYTALGLFCFATGQIAKAREVVDRYTAMFPRGEINVARLRETLAAASAAGSQPAKPRILSPQAGQQFLQLALAWADQIP